MVEWFGTFVRKVCSSVVTSRVPVASMLDGGRTTVAASAGAAATDGNATTVAARIAAALTARVRRWARGEMRSAGGLRERHPDPQAVDCSNASQPRREALTFAVGFRPAGPKTLRGPAKKHSFCGGSPDAVRDRRALRTRATS